MSTVNGLLKANGMIKTAGNTGKMEKLVTIAKEEGSISIRVILCVGP
jgi:hypothetical protein